MLQKKAAHADLNNFSKLFFQLGLLLTMIMVYTGLEWKTFERNIEQLNDAVFQVEEIEEIPMTKRELEIKPPPPPPPAPEQITVIENDVEIEETILESTETDEHEAVEYNEDLNDIAEVVEEEVVEEVPFAIIEEAPVFPGCNGNKKELKKCLQDKITAHVNKHYNTGLATDLGLSPGKKRVYVMFMIDNNGEIKQVQARGPHARLEKEAIKVIESLPKMKPGMQRGIPVKVRYSLPITLIVQT